MAALSEAFVSLLADPASRGKIKKAIESEVASANTTKAGNAAGAKASSGFATGFKRAAVGITKTAGLLGVGVAVAGVKMAADFQTATTRLVTAAGESEHNIKMVSDGILNVAKSTGTSTTALTKGMYQIESAGFHGAAGLNVLKAAAQGAKVEQADLGTVANALTTVMEDLHAPTSQAANLMSQMVAAVGHGKMTMDDLAGSIHSVLPNAAALHISFAQVAGALSTMTAQGIGADQAAQNLNHTIVKLAAPTLGMTKTMASYGLSSADVAKNLGKKGLTGTLEELTTAIFKHMGPAGTTLRSAFNESKQAAADAAREFKNLPPAAKQVATAYDNGTLTVGKYRSELKKLPATQASLLQQWKSGRDGANGFSAALKSGGTDSQTFTAALKDMLGDQTALQVALHLTGKASETFNSNVKAIAKSSSEAGGNVKDWSVVQETFNVKLAKLRETFQVLLIQIGTRLIPIFQRVVEAVSGVTEWFGKHSTAAKVLAGVLGGLVVTSILRVTAAWVAANLAFIATPIGAVITGLVALGVALVVAYRSSETFRDGVATAFHYVKTGAFELAIAFEKFLLIPILDIFSAIVHGAASAFGWVPGIGGKLKHARTAFDDFRAKVDQSLGGIQVALKTENAKYQASILQRQIDKIKQGKVPGLTVKNDAGIAKINELQARINALLQRHVPPLTVLSAAGKAKVAALQAQLDGMKQHKLPYVNIDTAKGKALAKSLQQQINDIRQGKVPDLTVNGAPLQVKIQALQAAINGMKQHRIPFANIDTAAGKEKLRELQQQLSGLQDKIVHVTVVGTNAVGQRTVAGGGKFAAGGVMKDGWSTVGEEGYEAIYKSGNKVQVYSHAASKALLGKMSAAVPGFASGTAATHDVTRSAYGGVVKAIIKEVRVGIPNARSAMHDLSRAMNDAFRLDGVSNQLKSARSRLKSLAQAANDLRSTVTSNLRQAFNAASAGADPSTGYVAGFSNILGDLQKNTALTSKFTKELDTLSRRGLDKTYLKQLAEAGPSQTIDVLAMSSTAQIKQLNKAFLANQHATAYAGNVAAHDVYSKAVVAQQRIVNTLTKQQRALQHDIATLVHRVETLTHHTTQIVLDGKVIARSVSLANARNARR